MHRTELVNMIKIVRLWGFPDLYARVYPLPKTAVSHCFVTIDVARDPQALLFFLKASSSPVHMNRKTLKSMNIASTLEENANTSGKCSGCSDARNGDG